MSTCIGVEDCLAGVDIMAAASAAAARLLLVLRFGDCFLLHGVCRATLFIICETLLSLAGVSSTVGGGGLKVGIGLDPEVDLDAGSGGGGGGGHINFHSIA